MIVKVQFLTYLLYHVRFSYGTDDVFHENNTALTWPPEYHLKGEEIYVLGGVTEPFETWYSKEKRRSRQDLYGGLVKNYNMLNSVGLRTYYIHSETTRELNGVRECRVQQEEGGELESYLPDVKGFVFKGEESENGRVLQIWKVEEVNVAEVEVRKKTLYVYETDKYHVPVRYEYKKYGLISGGLEFHRLTLYYNYNGTISTDDVSVEKAPDSKKCSTFEMKPHSNSRHDETFDPGLSFHGFKHLHNKKYDFVEHEWRKTIYEDNLRYIAEHNRKGLGYTLKATSFADRSDEELASSGCILPLDRQQLGSENVPYKDEELDAMADDVPEELDLRMKGLVNVVRNQLYCGSCWTFATTGTVEGALAMKNGGKLLDLSEQSLLDCGWGYTNFGCQGGFLNYAFKYVLANGIPTEREYGSYLMEEGQCNIDNMTDLYKIRGFGQVTVGSVGGLKAALNKYGPVAATLYASKKMNLYSSGIFYDPKCNNFFRNHAVIIVGYGTRDGTPYWIVKNSWGETWGEGGYILMSAKDNNCFLLNELYYAVV